MSYDQNVQCRRRPARPPRRTVWTRHDARHAARTEPNCGPQDVGEPVEVVRSFRSRRLPPTPTRRGELRPRPPCRKTLTLRSQAPDNVPTRDAEATADEDHRPLDDPADMRPRRAGGKVRRRAHGGMHDSAPRHPARRPYRSARTLLPCPACERGRGPQPVRRTHPGKRRRAPSGALPLVPRTRPSCRTAPASSRCARGAGWHPPCPGSRSPARRMRRAWGRSGFRAWPSSSGLRRGF